MYICIIKLCFNKLTGHNVVFFRVVVFLLLFCCLGTLRLSKNGELLISVSYGLQPSIINFGAEMNDKDYTDQMHCTP